MTLNKKNILTTIMFAGLFTPFITLTDFFPFLRFGMFAEPIQTNVQTENFLLYIVDKDSNRVVFDSEMLGISSNTFLYLCRNYYYRNESRLFFEKIAPQTDSSIVKLELYRTLNNSQTGMVDTIKVDAYIRNGKNE
jgi:hypothetical protein